MHHFSRPITFGIFPSGLESHSPLVVIWPPIDRGTGSGQNTGGWFKAIRSSQGNTRVYPPEIHR